MTRATENLAAPLADEHAWARDLAVELVKAAQKAGAVACDATVGLGSSLSAKSRDGEIEELTRSRSRAAGVRVVKDGRLGFATSAEAPRTPEAVAELARTAVALAEVSTSSPHNVLPEAKEPDAKALEERVRALELWDGDIAGADTTWACEQALEMERVLRSTKGIATTKEVGAQAQWGIFALATSTGFCGSFGGTSASLYASGVADDEGGKKQVDGWWHAARRLVDLDPAEAVAREAARRVLARIGARKVASTKAPVIFDPVMAKGFFAAILSAIHGDAVARRASFLADKKGEVVLAPGIRLHDDPLLVRGFGSRPFDGEGLSVRAMDLIDEDGRLRTFLLDARSASQLGERPTGHASRGSTSLPHPSSSNVSVLGGRGDLESILRETERGLLVTSLMGHSPDLITGEYSRGASGFWIEGGEIAYPVEEVTIAGHMLELMKGIDRVGADLDRRSSLHAPTIRFAELAISGS